jgi:hypothetical protein
MQSACLSRLQFLTAVLLKIRVFSRMTLYRRAIVADVSKNRSAFNFSIKYSTLRKPEEEGSINSRNAGTASIQHSVSPQTLGSSRIASTQFLDYPYENWKSFVLLLLWYNLPPQTGLLL